jgi:hypothetical protein
MSTNALKLGLPFPMGRLFQGGKQKGCQILCMSNVIVADRFIWKIVGKDAQ